MVFLLGFEGFVFFSTPLLTPKDETPILARAQVLKFLIELPGVKLVVYFPNQDRVRIF